MLPEKLRNLGKNLAIQGELIGERIQKNIYRIKGQTMRVYRIYDIDSQKKMGLKEMQEILNELDLEMVPIIDGFSLPENIKTLLEIAEGKSLLNPNTKREGLVIKSLDENISFKAISNSFLLEEE
jgi:ATP-dependent RNA circularization protein (DNA/RNA ligase family)